MEKSLIYVASNKIFIFSFSISFVCLIVILLILCVISLWDSAAAHSPSGKDLTPSSQEDAHSSGRYPLAYKFHSMLRRPSLGAIAHSPSDREFIPSSLEESCLALFLCCCAMFSYYPDWALFGLALTQFTQ